MKISKNKKNLKTDSHFLSALAEKSHTFFFYRLEFFPERKFTYISPSVKKIGGYSPEEFYSDANIIFKIIHPEDLLILTELFESKTLPKEKWVFRWVKKDGKTVWLGHTIIPITDDSSNIVAIEGTAQDITHEVETQKKIAESESKFKVLAETASTAIFIYSDENIVYVNPACSKLTGYTKDELLKMRFWEIVHPDFRKLVKKRGIKRIKGEKLPKRYPVKIVCKNGQERWVDYTGGLITYQGKPAVIGTAHDITELKTSEEKLKEAAESWRSTFDAIEDQLSIIDLKRKVLRCNKAQAKFLKKPIDSLLDKMLCRQIHGKSGKIEDCPVEKAEKIKKRARCIVKLKDKWFSVTADPIFDNKGKITGFVHLMRDITNIKEAEKELEEKERFLKNIFDSVQDGISILDTNLNILMTNKTMERWYSYSMPLVGKKCFQAYHKQNEPCKFCPSIKTLKTGQAAYKIVPKRDKKRNVIGWFDLFSFPFIDPESGKIKGVVEYARDITARKKTEEKLKQTNRLLNLLSKANEAIMRATDEQTLLNEVCKIVVKIGGYSGAWIGCYNEEKNLIQLKAKAGQLKDLGIYRQIPCGKESYLFFPACETIKNKKIMVINELEKEISKPEWIIKAQKKGFPSMVSLPLIIENKAAGLITIYAPEPNSFTTNEIKILQDLASDITFGILSLRTKKEMEATQEKLIATVGKLRQQEKIAQELSRSIIGAQEKERLYLASEIHDNLLQSLVASYYLLGALDFPPAYEKVQKQKEELCQLLRTSIAEGRALLRKIQPISKPDFSLKNGIKEAMELIFAATKTSPHLSCPAELPITNKEEKINILRIIQEALINARKHAQARNVWVKITCQDHLLEVEIKDDGVGFDEKKLGKSSVGHFGLLTMKERAKIFGAKLFIESSPGKGTKIRVLMPLKKQE